jgi:hypothetical protein
MDMEKTAINVFIDNTRRLRALTCDLPRDFYYPKRSSRGVRELNRDARLALRQCELTINQGVSSGILGPSNLRNLVMLFLNDAGMLMARLYEMRNRGEVSRKTWRRGRRLHRQMWTAVGNPPHNEF